MKTVATITVHSVNQLTTMDEWVKAHKQNFDIYEFTHDFSIVLGKNSKNKNIVRKYKINGDEYRYDDEFVLTQNEADSMYGEYFSRLVMWAPKELMIDLNFYGTVVFVGEDFTMYVFNSVDSSVGYIVGIFDNNQDAVLFKLSV